MRLRRGLWYARGLRGTHDTPWLTGGSRDVTVQVSHLRVHPPMLLKVQKLGGQKELYLGRGGSRLVDMQVAR